MTWHKGATMTNQKKRISKLLTMRPRLSAGQIADILCEPYSVIHQEITEMIELQTIRKSKTKLDLIVWEIVPTSVVVKEEESERAGDDEGKGKGSGAMKLDMKPIEIPQTLAISSKKIAEWLEKSTPKGPPDGAKQFEKITKSGIDTYRETKARLAVAGAPKASTMNQAMTFEDWLNACDVPARAPFKRGMK
jgi:hypothetical protein